MKGLSDGKKALLGFYAKYDTYLSAALKFGLAFFALYYLCRHMGYMEVMGQIPLLVIIAAFCSFMAPNTLLLAGVVYLEGQFYGCSLESAIVGGFFLLLFLLLYYTFIPQQAYVIILTSLCISLKLPLIVPVVCALLGGFGTITGILFGTGLYYAVLQLGKKPETAVGVGEELLNRSMLLLQRLFAQEELILMLVILSAVFLVVYLLHRLPVKYSWQIAAAAGILVYCLLVLMGAAVMAVKVSPVSMIPDVLLAAAAGMIVPFFCFRLDYKKVQYLQFEDDDYYYYVKAVPRLDRPDSEEHCLTAQEEEDYYLD